MSRKTLAEWLDLVEKRHPVNIELGLDRCMAVLSRLDVIRPSKKVITVAGTNGKGSTCAFLTKYFVETGAGVGSFTSPHFLHFNERIAIDGKPVSDDRLVEAFEAIEAVRGDVSLTYFEVNTLIAIWLFSQAKLDYWVLEVGLGGRLDSVNMIDADVAVITSIALDHVDWLGSSLAGIAREKAGICRKGKPLVVGLTTPPTTIAETATDVGAVLCGKGSDFNATYSESHWQWDGMGHSFAELPYPSLPLENASTFIAALVCAEVEVDAAVLSDVLRNAELMGRFQTVDTNPLTIIDVAHNEEAAAQLANKLSSFDRSPIALCGMLKDKDIAAVLERLKGTFSQWHFVSLDVPRGAKAADLQHFEKSGLCYEQMAQALAAARQQAANESRALIVFGSFHTVADFLLETREGL